MCTRKKELRCSFLYSGSLTAFFIHALNRDSSLSSGKFRAHIRFAGRAGWYIGEVMTRLLNDVKVRIAFSTHNRCETLRSH
jgi:hypothetical protein